MKVYLYFKKNMFIPLLLVVLFVGSLLSDNITTLFPGYLEILKSKAILITDFLEVGGLNSTLFNAFTILLINYVLIKIVKLRVSGPIFAGLMLITGFSFFGINTINFLPIYFGIYIYSRIKRVEYRSLIIAVLFSCGISSLLSFIYFGLPLELYFSIPLGIFVGILLGLIIPALAGHVIIFHSGYNLYNIGFSLGLLSVVAFGVCNAFNIEIFDGFELTVNNNYHDILLIGLLSFSIFFIINGLVNFKSCIENYKKILSRSGRLLQDFIRDYEHDAVLLNVGVNLLFCITLVLILNIQLTGPLVASLFTVVGFSAMGKHIKNIYPVILGALLAVFVAPNIGLDNISVQIGIFFVTSIAPLSGRYGVIIGIIAGFIHVIITPTLGYSQGPFNLYLNGYIGGIVAAILISVIERYEKELSHDI